MEFDFRTGGAYTWFYKETFMSTEESNKINTNYVDNQRLTAEMTRYSKQYSEWKRAASKNPGLTKPKISEYLGTAILQISNGLASKPNFKGYVFVDEMISDGVENCLQYLYNFDETISPNGFAYLTQIIYYAFIRRIGKEKKQMAIKQSLRDDLFAREPYRRRAGAFERGIGDPTPSDDHLGGLSRLEYSPDSGSDPVEKPKSKKKKAKKPRNTPLTDIFE